MTAKEMTNMLNMIIFEEGANMTIDETIDLLKDMESWKDEDGNYLCFGPKHGIALKVAISILCDKKMETIRVSKVRMNAFMNLWDRDKGQTERLRMYCYDEDNNKYIGLDNMDGKCLVKKFKNYDDLKMWFFKRELSD